MQQPFFGEISKVFIGFPRKKPNKNKKCLIATRSVILLVYICEQNNVKVVMNLCSRLQLRILH